ncbi:peptidoglycan-binding domain-containing protein [Psychromonas sp.]|jgi:peptidoglycan hydrolase-like protein with peptidoglycan-binding domain|uniref:peptidoglycan-binding domain-containing protein n=1 Tax=Psychromonas sp. TaxID=1884585 RepID=UPI003A97F574
MKFSTLIIVCGLVFTQQAFAENNGKNTSDCHSNNTQGCTTTNNNNNAKQQGSKTVVQTTTKTTVTTQQKSGNASKEVMQTSKQTEQSSKASVKNSPEVQKKAVTTTRTTTKAVSGQSLVLQTQQQLNRLGYKAGKADGLMGKNTREAIKRFQKQHNIRVDGKSSSALLALLKKANKK